MSVRTSCVSISPTPARSSAEELRDIEDAVNARIADGEPVRALSTTLQEAKRLGAMALFGEKYGEVVRMVQIGDGSYSRELCGGTHVRNTAEIGPFLIVKESSSAANVRRIEALTGAAATELLRTRERDLRAIETAARTPAAQVPALLRGLIEAKASARDGTSSEVDIDALAAQAVAVGDVPVLAEAVSVANPKALLELLDRLRGRLQGGAIVLGTAVDDRVHLAAAVAPALVERGVKAGEVVKAAATVAGGGGGGRDTLAQAGGRDPSKLDAALAAARGAIEAALAP